VSHYYDTTDPIACSDNYYCKRHQCMASEQWGCERCEEEAADRAADDINERMAEARR
jgi:hypothetical protein